VTRNVAHFKRKYRERQLIRSDRSALEP